MKNPIILLAILLICLNIVRGQNTQFFNNYVVKKIDVIFPENFHPIKSQRNKPLLPGDSVVIKKYILINNEGDSLFLMQKVPFKFQNGEIYTYAWEVTDMLVYIEQDSCYTISYRKDPRIYNDAKRPVFSKVDFIFKGKTGSMSKSDTSNCYYIYRINGGNCILKIVQQSYKAVYDSLNHLLDYKDKDGFRKAVFMVENAFAGFRLNYDVFDFRIRLFAEIIKAWQMANYNSPANRDVYKAADSANYAKNYSLFHFFKYNTTIIGDRDTTIHQPYTYNFKDFFGKEDWSNMFVTKLLIQNEGNCHSLPYLYKILADELDASCWIGLAPNHMYIKCRNKRDGWFNLELTSGTFPTDAWIMGSGYITNEAVQNGIYMDTLSNIQSIGLCFLDLAKGYERKTKNYVDGFILKCCDKTLDLIPNNVQALLLKAETLKKVYGLQNRRKETLAAKTYVQMENLYVKLADLGYREMPDNMYLSWLSSAAKEGSKSPRK